MWTQEALHELLRAGTRDCQLIVVGNREPYIHRRINGEVRCILPASGLATALDPVMQACGGTWVAHGSGDADRSTADGRGRIRVPPGRPNYTLRRVWLTPEQEEGYYYGVANNSLWPLCHVGQTELIALHRLADFCIVSSLHDGMNLVAKEYVASQCDNRGALILSRFTGSARELTDALLVNPFSSDEIAGAIHAALQMPREERERRMSRMRAAVAENNIYRWAGKIISSLLKLPLDAAPAWHLGQKVLGSNAKANAKQGIT